MTKAQLDKWKSVEEFEIDDADSDFKFSHRLARENSWTLEFSLRAILEYKKFIFMICISEKALTPSDEIDQVWHLHLLYTQSYWIDLCQDTILRNIHHGPTKGVSQRGDFKEQYNNTIMLYRNIFSEEPPYDIWPNPEKRFKTVHFSRVNRDENWVISKLKIKRPWKF